MMMEMQIEMDMGLGDESGIETCERRNHAAKGLSRRLRRPKGQDATFQYPHRDAAMILRQSIGACAETPFIGICIV